MRNQNGIALVTALLMMTFLFILGVAYQSFLTEDLRFASQQESGLTAFYLAKSGMAYYAQAGLPNKDISIPSGDSHHFCSIIENPDNHDVTFTGYVTAASGNVIAQRVLVAPGGNLENWFER